MFDKPNKYDHFFSFFSFAFAFTLCVFTLVPKDTAILYARRIGFEWDSLLCCVVNGKKETFGADEKKNYTQVAQRCIINGDDKKNHS